MKPYRVVELFAGIGAWSKALEKLHIPHDVVYAAEKEPQVIKAYNVLHHTAFPPLDVTQINPHEVPDHDILCYSPPCQAFSAAGKKEGFADSRGTLFFHAYQILKTKKPKFALMENVKGLISPRFEQEFQSMLTLLEEAGYQNYWNILNAKDYGLPQNRERIFIVSIRNDQKQDFTFPSPIPLSTSLSDFIENEADISYDLSKEKSTWLEARIKEKDGGKTLAVKGDLMTRHDPQRQYGFGSEWMFTIRSAIPHGIALYQNGGYRMRKLTESETFRFMGFDAGDVASLQEKGISKTLLYRMAGNSIAVPVVQALFRQLFIEKK